MSNVPLAKSDYFREVAQEARILLRNRYFEGNPVLTNEQIALLERMGLRRFLYLGEGPIREIYSQPGSFNDAVFIVSGNEIYRLDVNLTVTQIFAGLGSAVTGGVSMAATSNIGTTPEFLFIADGQVLLLYIANGYALGALTGTAANTDVVRVDTMYYRFTNASVDAGTPLGTVGNPWLVALGGSNAEAIQNLADAFGDAGIPGTQYSTALTSNPNVQTQSTGTNTISIRATAPGVLGNAIITTETGAGLAWGAGTLTGGGGPSCTQVETPGDVGIISLGYSASHVVAVPAQGEGINGRFYWIEPGETTIDPINFATAERAPDPIFNVSVFGDQFWLPGSDTTEPWYFTGNEEAPVQRLQGVVFDQGTWEGTAVRIKDCMIIVDADGNPFQISGGIKPIGRPDIVERIREAMQYQASQTIV